MFSSPFLPRVYLSKKLLELQIAGAVGKDWTRLSSPFKLIIILVLALSIKDFIFLFVKVFLKVVVREDFHLFLILFALFRSDFTRESSVYNMSSDINVN